MSKKVKPVIDESFMREMISQGLSGGKETETSQPKKKKEKPKPIPRKRVVVDKNTETHQTDYEKTYFQKLELPDRQSVYVSRETHEKLMRITSVLGKGRVTVSGYVESIIQNHFEEHKEEVNRLYEANKDMLL